MIYQVDESTRSSHSNAYMFGFGRNKRIVLFDTLLQNSHEHIVAIVGHELGHWRLNHVVKNMVIAFAHMFIMFYLFGFVLNNDQIYKSFGFMDINNGNYPVVIGLILFSNIYEPVRMSLFLDLFSGSI